MSGKKFNLFSLDTLVLIVWLVATAALFISYASSYADPRSFSFVPLFGLAYPLIISANLVLFLYWLIRKRWKLVFTSLVFIIIGFPLHSRFITFSKSTSPSESANSLQVMSYNVRLFDVYNWLERGTETRDDIYAYLENNPVDVLCFQEFYYEESTGEYNTIQTIRKRTGLSNKHGRYTSGSHGKAHFGVITFSRYPIINSGHILLNSVASNHCIYTDIQKDSVIFRVYNLHIGSIQIQDDEYDLFSEKPNNLKLDKTERSKRLVGRLLSAYTKRIEQVEVILEHSKQSPYPVIICGDFNDTPISYAYNQFHKHYTDAFLTSGNGIGTTYTGKIPANRIDFIFYDTSFHATDFKIQEEILSDHRAIQSTLEIRSLNSGGE